MTACHVRAFGLASVVLMAQLFVHREKDLGSFTLLFPRFGFLLNMAVGLLGLRIYIFMTLDRY